MRTLIPVLCIALASSSIAATIHVPGDQPTIQAGIDAAEAGDTVLVACGVYLEIQIELKSGICLRGENGDPDCVVIDGQARGRIMRGEDLDGSTLIEGLTFANGWLPSEDPGIEFRGAGLILFSSYPRIMCCNFLNNAASSGGAIYCNHSDPTVESCAFIGNRLEYFGGSGGAVMCGDDTAPLFRDCEFIENTSVFCGGAVTVGIGAGETGAQFVNCTFIDNMAADSGSAIVGSASAIIRGCTFVGNEGSSMGGQLRFYYHSYPIIENCIVAFSETAGILLQWGAAPAIACCDIYGNAGGDWIDELSDDLGVRGNISLDPMFCGDENPGLPFSLFSTSPCSAGNNPGCGQIGAWPVGCEAVVTQAVTWSAVKALY